MISFFAQLPDLVIPNGETDSNFLQGSTVFNDGVGIMIYAPAGLTETVNFQVSVENELNRDGIPVTPTTWWNLVDAAGAVAVPAAGNAQVFQLPTYAGSLRLVSGSAVGAARTFKVSKIYTATGAC